MRVALIAAAICVALFGIARAQVAGYLGGNNSKLTGSIGLIGGGVVPTPCTGQGQLDFNSNCTLVYAGH